MRREELGIRDESKLSFFWFKNCFGNLHDNGKYEAISCLHNGHVLTCGFMNKRSI